MALYNPLYSGYKKVKLDRDFKLTETTVTQLIQNHSSQNSRYESLYDYYRGRHSILYRTFDDTSKPNNKIVNNFASYIVGIRAGYFTGLPVIYNSKNTQYLEDVEEIFEYNYADDVTHELDVLTNIYGHGYELFWIDEDGQLRFKQLKPQEVIMIYSNDIAEEKLYAIRYYKEQSIYNESIYNEYVYVYDRENVTEYTYVLDNTGVRELTGFDTYPHLFQEVPLIEYVNNEDRMASFEDVVSIIDAYNTAQSDSVNEVQYFNDAYLKLINLSATDDEDIADMKNNRVIMVEGDGDAEWLTKQINDTYLEHLKERMAKDIHKFSKTPNLVSDEFISNLSGTAIRYKVWGLEQDTASKERKWQKSINERLKFITYVLNAKGSSYEVSDIVVTFNRNLPQNVMELGQMASQLNGIVSQETLLEQIPFVSDVYGEMDRLKKQKESNLEMFGGFGNTGQDKQETETVEEVEEPPQEETAEGGR